MAEAQTPAGSIGSALWDMKEELGGGLAGLFGAAVLKRMGMPASPVVLGAVGAFLGNKAQNEAGRNDLSKWAGVAKNGFEGATSMIGNLAKANPWLGVALAAFASYMIGNNFGGGIGGVVLALAGGMGAAQYLGLVQGGPAAAVPAGSGAPAQFRAAAEGAAPAASQPLVATPVAAQVLQPSGP